MSGAKDSESELRRFEVGVEPLDGSDFQHVTVEAESPEEAFEKGKDESKFRRCNAYQAFEIDAGVTHHP